MKKQTLVLFLTFLSLLGTLNLSVLAHTESPTAEHTDDSPIFSADALSITRPALIQLPERLF